MMTEPLGIIGDHFRGRGRAVRAAGPRIPFGSWDILFFRPPKIGLPIVTVTDISESCLENLDL